jgi:hypothetical protein
MIIDSTANAPPATDAGRVAQRADRQARGPVRALRPGRRAHQRRRPASEHRGAPMAADERTRHRHDDLLARCLGPGHDPAWNITQENP